jgi:dTDP-4-dehydrorhamnose reductase
LLVTGIDTLAGANLALALADRCEVLGLYDRCALASGIVPTACWRGDDPAALAAHVEGWQPHWIIHCGPLAASSWDEPPGESAARREPAVASRLAELSEAWGSRLTVISSDVVFAGPRMFHDESAPTTGPAARAASVQALERAVEGREALVVRTHVYGWSFNPQRAGFAGRMFEALESRTPLALDGRRHATPILATDLAELLWRAFETRLHGLYHLAGAERTSPRRFVLELADAMHVALPAWASDDLSAASWPDETSLSSKRARRMLAAATPMLREGLNRFVAQAANGWREALRPSAHAAAA